LDKYGKVLEFFPSNFEPNDIKPKIAKALKYDDDLENIEN
jgi:hypothetical protein